MTDEMTAAARDVLAERKRQIEVEGCPPDQDDCYSPGEMALAAAGYSFVAGLTPTNRSRFVGPDRYTPWQWPWSRSWWKPTDPRRDLVKAGALILAEIERIDRASREDAALPAASPSSGEG